jgi:hypothetical protein
VRVSIVVPSLATVYLNYMLRALRSQSVRPSEVVIVVRGNSKNRLGSAAGASIWTLRAKAQADARRQSGGETLQVTRIKKNAFKIEKIKKLGCKLLK